MRRRGPGDGVVQVELVEADADLEVDGADDGGGGDAREAVRARRLRWVGLAVVVTLVGTTLTATVIDARQDAARRVALAELDWVLPPIEGPLEEVWRAPGGWVSAVAAGLLVVQDSMGSGVRALEVATGSVRWERTGTASENCTPVLGDQSTEVRYPTADTLVCLPYDAYYQDGLPEPEATFSVVAVDIATGSDAGSLDIDGGLLMQDSVDADVLLTFIDATAAIGAVRWDPLVGEVWSYRSAPGVLPDGAVWGSPDGWRYERREDVLQLTDDLALNVDTGRQVPVVATEPGPRFEGHVENLSDGGRAEWRWGAAGSGWTTGGRVLDPDGSLRFEVDGGPWSLWATDGSAPESILVLRTTGEAVALDPDTGSELWSAPGMSETWPAFLLEGTLVVAGPTTVTALDARDGTTLWQMDTGWASNSLIPTDGDVVLVQVESGAGAELVALDLRTGTEAWRRPAPGSAGYWDMVSTADLFLLVSEDGILALR